MNFFAKMEPVAVRSVDGGVAVGVTVQKENAEVLAKLN